MDFLIKNNGVIVCPKCGGDKFTASIEAELDVEFCAYKNGAYADIGKPDFDDYDLMDITCSNCNYVIADTFIELNDEVKKRGNEDGE